jgi:hypothetical protein
MTKPLPNDVLIKYLKQAGKHYLMSGHHGKKQSNIDKGVMINNFVKILEGDLSELECLLRNGHCFYSLDVVGKFPKVKNNYIAKKYRNTK